MGLRGKLRRLERGARGNLESFVLEDGSRYYFNPTSAECFLHACACVRAQHKGEPFPEPPQTIKALTRARNRAAALDTACGGGGASLGLFPYEREALLERGELVPRSLVASRELGESLESEE
jgi:hypothetical protein